MTSTPPWRRPPLRTLVLACIAAAGCSRLGTYVWSDAYVQPAAAPRTGYVIAPGDLLNIRVWNQDGISGRIRVRPDGKISLPFIDDVEAAGLEPAALSRRIQVRLKEFIVNPIVTTSLEELAPFEVMVLGEVAKQGIYRLEADAGLIKAIASAGGLTEAADRDRIFVLHRASSAGPSDPPVRIRFRYESLIHLEGSGARFRLHPGDVIVVE